MKRLHVHVSVDDLDASIRFYSTLFAAEPTVHKPAYARWVIDDPVVNFAISQRGAAHGIDHLGIEADSLEELADVHDRLILAESSPSAVGDPAFYTTIKKTWTSDPTGIAWEAFFSLSQSAFYSDGEDRVEAPTIGVSAPAVSNRVLGVPEQDAGAISPSIAIISAEPKCPDGAC